jgi:hypothetical protein
VIDDRWGAGPPSGGGADELDQLVHLSTCIGQEARLVQPGGGNTSTKVGDRLLVKGSGTDLRTIGRAGFTQLSLSALAALRTVDKMGDAEMMQFMAAAMTTGAGPMPSVETPLHALLPARVIAHTHDVATMSLTNVSEATAQRVVQELFAGEVVLAPYVRRLLAQAVSRMVDALPTPRAGAGTTACRRTRVLRAVVERREPDRGVSRGAATRARAVRRAPPDPECRDAAVRQPDRAARGSGGARRRAAGDSPLR